MGPGNGAVPECGPDVPADASGLHWLFGNERGLATHPAHPAHRAFAVVACPATRHFGDCGQDRRDSAHAAPIVATVAGTNP
jgi:hypothetical protein